MTQITLKLNHQEEYAKYVMKPEVLLSKEIESVENLKKRLGKEIGCDMDDFWIKHSTDNKKFKNVSPTFPLKDMKDGDELHIIVDFDWLDECDECGCRICPQYDTCYDCYQERAFPYLRTESKAIREFRKEQTVETCLEVIRWNPDFLEFIEEQTEEICMAAVKADGMTLRFVDEQTKEICLEAVQHYPKMSRWGFRESGSILSFVEEQSDEICLEAVEHDPDSLQCVEKQNDEICMAAVERNWRLLEFVEKQNKEMCTIAVEDDGMALRYIQEQSDEMCMIAVKDSGMNLEYVKDQTYEICMVAVKECNDSMEFIEDKEIKKRIENEMLE